MGRTEKKIDWQRVDEMLQAGCLGTEIAAYFDLHPHTFYDKVFSKFNMLFTDYSRERKGVGESVIREAQFNKAIKSKDNTMLIWLGKQRLNQRETPIESEVSQDITKRYLEVIEQLASLQRGANSSPCDQLATPEE